MSGDLEKAAVADQRPEDCPGSPGLIDSQRLLCGQTSIQIKHGGEVYSLRLTRNNRLILTK